MVSVKVKVSETFQRYLKNRRGKEVPEEITVPAGTDIQQLCSLLGVNLDELVWFWLKGRLLRKGRSCLMGIQWN